MFTRQFFDLLLDLNENWKVSSVDADYKKEEVYIKIEYIAKKAEHPDSMDLLSI